MAAFDTFCEKASPYDPTKVPADFFVEEKVRGFRCLFLRGKFRTWEGKTVPIAPPIVEAAEAVRVQRGPVILDGVFQAVSLNHEEKQLSGIFHVFDLIRGTSFNDRERGDGGVNRRIELKTLMLGRDLSKPGLKLVERLNLPEKGDANEKILAVAEKVWAIGGLGVMIKDSKAFYGHGRSDRWMSLTREDVPEKEGASDV